MSGPWRPLWAVRGHLAALAVLVAILLLLERSGGLVGGTVILLGLGAVSVAIDLVKQLDR